jgi:hypothetical protein
MAQLTINEISGATPVQIYACDSFGNQCELVLTYNNDVPFPYSIPLPTKFDVVPQIMVKMIDNNNCELLKLATCDELCDFTITVTEII